MSDLTDQSSLSSDSDTDRASHAGPSGTSRTSRGRGRGKAARGRGARGARGAGARGGSAPTKRAGRGASLPQFPPREYSSPSSQGSRSSGFVASPSPELGAPPNGQSAHDAAPSDNEEGLVNLTSGPEVDDRQSDSQTPEEDQEEEEEDIDLEENDDADGSQSSSLSETSSLSSTGSPGPQPAVLLNGSSTINAFPIHRGLKRGRSSPLTDLSADESDKEHDRAESDEDEAPPTATSKRSRKRVVESESGSEDDATDVISSRRRQADDDDDGSEFDDDDDDDAAAEARAFDLGEASPALTDSNAPTRDGTPNDASRDTTPAPRASAFTAKSRGRGRPRGAKKSFPTSGAGRGRASPKNTNTSTMALQSFLTPMRATRATVTLPPGYIEGIGSSRWPKTSQGGSHGKTTSVEPSERHASEESQMTEMTVDVEEVSATPVDDSPAPVASSSGSKREEETSAEPTSTTVKGAALTAKPAEFEDDTQWPTPNIALATPTEGDELVGEMAVVARSENELVLKEEEDVSTEPEVEVRASPKPKPKAAGKKGRKGKQKAALDSEVIPDRPTLSKRRRLSEGEIERNAQRNTARMALLAQLAAEEQNIIDGTHPMVEAAYTRLREEKRRRIAGLSRTQSWREIAYERERDASIQKVWVAWADAKDQLRMSMFTENHQSLRQLVYEEKQLPFLRDHPLLMDECQVPPAPHFRAPILEGNQAFTPRKVIHAGHYLEAPPTNKALDHSAGQLSNEEINADLAVLMNPDEVFGPPRPQASPAVLDVSPIMTAPRPVGVPVYPYAPAYYYVHASQYGSVPAGHPAPPHTYYAMPPAPATVPTPPSTHAASALGPAQHSHQHPHQHQHQHHHHHHHAHAPGPAPATSSYDHHHSHPRPLSPPLSNTKTKQATAGSLPQSRASLNGTSSSPKSQAPPSAAAAPPALFRFPGTCSASGNPSASLPAPALQHSRDRDPGINTYPYPSMSLGSYSKTASGTHGQGVAQPQVTSYSPHPSGPYGWGALAQNSARASPTGPTASNASKSESSQHSGTYYGVQGNGQQSHYAYWG
ncbi:hypothetical protein MVLG_03625 [Microbotryum lychnidis-dioicae p1A1 Lamole]|uniref:Uncharacterized protein n=1 Tax=Microbotryum lychnidis-dioicae (strain p1A1 Lamole / MvSl-1064) TaxID=683840 RepID=U5H8S4_USTV1|nr:hypothetical protein MVLG_03625 [Microbotryum lychnidis-dioicae p1A1 Lamole]|eukprot:KDE06073.1 hypothetical protein MVLG_03625 [Microbotryum lychnidis-dioicae p1A1 Lamole]